MSAAIWGAVANAERALYVLEDALDNAHAQQMRIDDHDLAALRRLWERWQSDTAPKLRRADPAVDA